MSKFSRFKEYLDAKGNLQEKPIVKADADTGPEPAKTPPTPATSGKNWKSEVPLADKPKDYAPATSPVKLPKFEKGLGDDGDKKLIYEPETPAEIGKEGGKKLPSWPKVATTEEFLAKTRGMSLSEFTSFISNKNKVTEWEGEDHPFQAFAKINKAISQNPSLMEAFIREVKRNGAFDLLVAELFKHSETFTEMAFLMNGEEGKNICRQFVKTLHETTINEITDAPAEETEVTKDDLKDLTPKKKTLDKDIVQGRKNIKSLEGEKVDMGNSNVMASRGQLTPEHNLVSAVINNKATLRILQAAMGQRS